MTEIKDEPAFPSDKTEVVLRIGHEDCAQKILVGIHQGLSKRELIAAMAMQGLLSNSNGIKTVKVDGKDLGYIQAAKYLADTLLKELSK